MNKFQRYGLSIMRGMARNMGGSDHAVFSAKLADLLGIMRHVEDVNHSVRLLLLNVYNLKESLALLILHCGGDESDVGQQSTPPGPIYK